METGAIWGMIHTQRMREELISATLRLEDHHTIHQARAGKSQLGFQWSL